MVTEKRTSRRPNPAEFSDFRGYLEEMVAYLKGSVKGFSFRSFAAKAGYSSPSFLKHVVEGKRNLTPDSIGRFSEALGLSAKERDDFESLVLLGQAKNDRERNHYYGRLRKGARQGPVELEKSQYEAYSLWYAFPIHELLRHEEFQEDPAWIAKRLNPPIRPNDAKRALEVLENLGLVARSEDGRLRPVHRELTTPGTVRSLAVRNYHRAMLEHAARSLDTLPLDRRNVTSVTVSLTREQYERVCKKVSELEDEIMAIAGERDPEGSAREIYVAGVHVVPVTGGK